MTSRVMLSDAGSNAFGRSEHCFRALRAMLLDVQSYALDYKEHAFGPYRAMLPMVRSSGPVADDEDLKFRKAMLLPL